MPALHPVPGVIRIDHHFSLGSDQNTGFHLFMSYGPNPPTAGNLNAVADAGHTAWTTYWTGHTHPSTILHTIKVTDLSASDAAVGTWSGSVAGIGSSGVLPANAAVLVNFAVARRYRGGKPRCYIPSGGDSDLANAQQWTSAAQTAFYSAFQNLNLAYVGATNQWGSGATLVSVSYYQGHTWLPDQNGNYHRVPTPRPTPKVDLITAPSINPIVGSQRRRLRA